MDRRAFLRILGLASVAPLMPTSLVSRFAPDIVAPAIGEVSAPLSLTWISMQMTKMLHEQLNRSFERVEGHRIGDQGCVQQFNIQHPVVEDIITPDEYRQRYLQPSAMALADRIERAKWTRFGRLSLPGQGGMAGYRAAETSMTDAGVGVRVVQGLVLDPDYGWREQLRFDVLGG